MIDIQDENTTALIGSDANFTESHDNITALRGGTACDEVHKSTSIFDIAIAMFGTVCIGYTIGRFSAQPRQSISA